MRADELSIAADAAIASRYAVMELLGKGGFAKVFHAKQRSTGQAVAIKLLEVDTRPGAPPIEAQLERFRREALLCAELHHPNVVPLVDSGQTSEAQPFVVFAHVPGQDLGQLLAGEGALEPAEALHLMTQVLDALSCAHAKGIVHRDLKPGNVMINAAGARRNALVLDFGISTIVADGVLALRPVTEQGDYLGTPQYSAPEQLRGEPPNVLSDLYAWGLLFIECLTGETGIRATNPHQAIHLQLSPEPVPLPVALEGHPLHGLLSLATQKDAAKRRTSAAELLAALQRIDAAGLPSREQLLARASDRPLRSYPPVATGVRTTWLVPANRNANFTGREALLEQVARALQGPPRLPVVALHGLGGVGKSQLALEYAYRSADQHEIVAWIRAEGPETLTADYAGLASRFALPDTPNQRQKVEAVRFHLERASRFLLVFDNAPSPAAIRDYVPRLHAGHILVTSRHPSWRDIGGSVAVGVLEPGEAVEFLLKRTGGHDVRAAAELSEELGCLPLALEEAAAYIEATGRSLASYLQLLRKHRQRVLFHDAPVADSRAQLRTTWELSFQAVERELPRASDVLKLCAFLAPDDIPLALFQRGAKGVAPQLQRDLEDELSFDAYIATLRRYSLVKLEADSLSVHRLVQLATRERLAAEEGARWAATALQMVEAAYPWSAVAGEYHPESGRFLPHAVAVLAHAAPFAEQSQVAARLLRRTGGYLSARGLHEEACKRLTWAQSLLRESPEPDLIQMGTTLWELGMVHYALGESTRARADLEAGLEILEADADKALLLRAQTLLSLCWVHHTLGNFTATLSAATAALGLLLSKLREEHPLAATALALVARAQWSLGLTAEAKEYVDRAATAFANSPEPLHPLHAGTCYIVSRIRFDLGDLNGAFAIAREGQAIGERAYGREHPLVFLSVMMQGSVLLARGDAAAARACFDRVLESAERSSRYLHEEIALARSERAWALWLLGDPELARRGLEHALSELPRISGHKGRVAGHAHITFARLLRALGDDAGMREHCVEALRAIEADYGARHALCLPARGLL